MFQRLWHRADRHPRARTPSNKTISETFGIEQIEGVVSYEDNADEETYEATFTADAPYPHCEQFRVMVKGGENGIETSEGALLSDDLSWTFKSACLGLWTYDHNFDEDVGGSVLVTDNGIMYVAGLVTVKGTAPDFYVFHHIASGA